MILHYPVPEILAQRASAPASAPVPARPAATVMLLRDAATAPGVEVFAFRRHQTMAFAPGMMVFPGGAVEEADHVPGADPFRIAAARETFEECGVRVDPADLHPWARWITPAFEPRRFDTMFYVARLPEGEQPGEIVHEGRDGVWLAPAEALARHAAGDLPMLPPTQVCLEDLAALPDVATALAIPRLLDPVCPVLTTDQQGAAVLRVELPHPPGRPAVTR